MTTTPTDFTTLYASEPRASFFRAVVEDQSDQQRKLMLASWLIDDCDDETAPDEAAAWRKMAERGWEASIDSESICDFWRGEVMNCWRGTFENYVVDYGIEAPHRPSGLIRFVAAWCELNEAERPE